MVIGKAQEVKIDFITPSIVHVVKGQPTKSLVVIAQPEDVKVTSRGNDVSSSVLTIRKDPKTGDLTFLTVKGKVLLKEKSCDISKVRQTFVLDKDEAIYGLGTIQNGKMNRRGEHKRMEQSNLEDFQNVLQSIKGWGLYSSYFLDGQPESFKTDQLVGSFDPTDPEKTLEDKTFYAWMNPVVYTISYDLAGGEWGWYPSKQESYKATFLKNSYTEEKPLKLYNNQPSKARYRLKGWTADNPNVKFKSEVDGTSVSLSMLPGSIGNVTFTPIWEPRTFSITYWKNLSKDTYEMDAQYTSYTVDSEGFKLPVPVDEEMTAAGKTFQGWYATYNGSTGRYENKVESIEPRNPDNIAGKPETGIIGLYACWK